MFRNINDFEGDCLLVGGGWESEKYSLSYRNKNAFYTIDIDARAKPDLVADILLDAELLVSLFKGRFKFIYFEFFPVYKHDLFMAKIFETAFKMLAKDGVLVYVGGSYCLNQTIPELLTTVGFQFATSDIKSVECQREGRKEKGSVTLASKHHVESKRDFRHLPKEAIKCINKCFYSGYEFELTPRRRRLHIHSPVPTQSTEEMLRKLDAFPAPLRRLQPVREVKRFPTFHGCGKGRRLPTQRLKRILDRTNSLSIFENAKARQAGEDAPVAANPDRRREY